MSQNEEAAVFTRLGLTFLQSKVYLKLVDLGEATIKTIAEASNVARQELYRITGELGKEGLIEKVVANPTRYKAVQPYEGLSILLQRQRRENRKLHGDAVKLLKKYESGSRNSEKVTQEQTHQFILIPEREALIKKLENKLESTRESLDLVTTMTRFLQAMHHFLGVYTEALDRGVKIRVIVEKPENEKAFPETLQALAKNVGFELGFILAPPRANMIIFDRREAFVSVYPNVNLKESPAIMTNHPSFLAICQDHYETVWASATKCALKDVGRHEDLEQRNEAL